MPKLLVLSVLYPGTVPYMNLIFVQSVFFFWQRARGENIYGIDKCVEYCRLEETERERRGSWHRMIWRRRRSSEATFV